ncbi:hypothetical protein Hanom_Chr03g00231821 [Helianthus anomalus]
MEGIIALLEQLMMLYANVINLKIIRITCFLLLQVMTGPIKFGSGNRWREH